MNKRDLRELKIILAGILGIIMGYTLGVRIGYGIEILTVPIGFIYAIKIIKKAEK